MMETKINPIAEMLERITVAGEDVTNKARVKYTAIVQQVIKEVEGHFPDALAGISYETKPGIPFYTLTGKVKNTGYTAVFEHEGRAIGGRYIADAINVRIYLDAANDPLQAYWIGTVGGMSLRCGWNGASTSHAYCEENKRLEVVLTYCVEDPAV